MSERHRSNAGEELTAPTNTAGGGSSSPGLNVQTEAGKSSSAEELPALTNTAGGDPSSPGLNVQTEAGKSSSAAPTNPDSCEQVLIANQAECSSISGRKPCEWQESSYRLYTFDCEAGQFIPFGQETDGVAKPKKTKKLESNEGAEPQSQRRPTEPQAQRRATGSRRPSPSDANVIAWLFDIESHRRRGHRRATI